MNSINLMDLARENKIKLCLLLSLSPKGYRNNMKLNLEQVDSDMKKLLKNEITGLFKL